MSHDDARLSCTLLLAAVACSYVLWAALFRGAPQADLALVTFLYFRRLGENYRRERTSP